MMRRITRTRMMRSTSQKSPKPNGRPRRRPSPRLRHPQSRLLRRRRRRARSPSAASSPWASSLRARRQRERRRPLPHQRRRRPNRPRRRRLPSRRPCRTRRSPPPKSCRPRRRMVASCARTACRPMNTRCCMHPRSCGRWARHDLSTSSRRPRAPQTNRATSSRCPRSLPPWTAAPLAPSSGSTRQTQRFISSGRGRGDCGCAARCCTRRRSSSRSSRARASSTARKPSITCWSSLKLGGYRP